MGPSQGDPTPSEPASQALDRQFDDLGWCPHQYRRLQQERSADTLRYLSTLDRRSFRPNNHGACQSQPTCVANNVDMNKYATKHTQACSGLCSFVGVDYDQVVDIIRNGGVPIVGIHLEPASTFNEPVLRLTVTACAVSTRYTVISHVWFDGLGNPSANALPACQIQRLHAQLTSLPREYESSCFTIGSLQVDWWRQSFILNADSQPPLFWMDTLCIPVKSEHSHLRTKAINQMASVYAAATQELVLDAELMQCKARTTPALELLARMACSAWMTRSWTLQEGVLARECVFQFQDCAIDPTHEWCLHGPRPGVTPSPVAVSFPNDAHAEHWAVYAELYNTLWDTLHQDWKASYLRDPPKVIANRQHKEGPLHTDRVFNLPAVQGLSEKDQDGLDTRNFFAIQLGEEHRLKQLVDTWNELAQRSTTMPEDLHVIIANLLDFNADSIMRLPSREERMRAMVLSFDLLPVSLFWNSGPRWRECALTPAEGNNQWIPIEPSKCQLSSTPVMKVTPGWLELDLQRGASDAQILRIQQHGDRVARQSSFACSISPQQTYRVTLVDGVGERSIPNPHGVTDVIQYYLLIESSTLPNDLMKGALLRAFKSTEPELGGVLRLSYVCPVTLQVISGSLGPNEVHSVAEVLPLTTKVVVKYGQSFPQLAAPASFKKATNQHPAPISPLPLPARNTRATNQANEPYTDPIPGFTPYPRRLTRGPSLQGAVAPMIPLSIIGAVGVACMLAFITEVARPPHAFTPAAQGLLAAFLVSYIGGGFAFIGWMFYLETFKYRMWLASFESGWVFDEQPRWWLRYLRLERYLGGIMHAMDSRVRRTARALRERFTLTSKEAQGRQAQN